MILHIITITIAICMLAYHIELHNRQNTCNHYNDYDHKPGNWLFIIAYLVLIITVVVDIVGKLVGF